MIFSKNAFFGLLLVTTTAATAAAPSQSNLRGERKLQATKVTKTMWEDCISQDAGDCARTVRRDARRHVLPNLKVMVAAPRTNEEIKNTYMKVGIAINVEGIVTGDKNDGQITYPFVWVSAEYGEGRMLGPWDCSGKTSWECCSLIRADVPDMDIHGNHIQCFAHLDELVPDVRDDRPIYEEENLAYMTFIYDKTSGRYREKILSPSQVQAIHEKEQAALAAAEASLEAAMAGDSITIGELLTLEEELMEATAGEGDAQNLLGELEKEIEAATMGTDIGTLVDPNNSDDPVLQQPLSTKPKTKLADIMTAVHHKIHDYTASGAIMESHIWIYPSHNNKVWHAPRIGGKFSGHKEQLIEHNVTSAEIAGYEERDYDKLTGGARYLKWRGIEM